MILGARQKLNSAYLNGSRIVSGVVRVLMKSWIAFLIVAVVLIACCFNDGSIRSFRRRR